MNVHAAMFDPAIIALTVSALAGSSAVAATARAVRTWLGKQRSTVIVPVRKGRPYRPLLVTVAAAVIAVATITLIAIAGTWANHVRPPISQPPPSPTAPATGAVSATPDPSVEPSDINPGGQFTPAYQPQQQLELRPGNPCTQISVDLDEPRVNVSRGADFSMESCGGRQDFRFGDSTASVIGDPEATPAECADSIRTSPLAGNTAVPVTPNLVVCVATSPQAALEQGVTRKIAVVVVKAVANDQTVTLVVSAWNVPA